MSFANSFSFVLFAEENEQGESMSFANSFSFVSKP